MLYLVLANPTVGLKARNHSNPTLIRTSLEGEHLVVVGVV
jgi:hypothetical protein